MDEPSTAFDTIDYMWQDANDEARLTAPGGLQDRIYFNGVMSFYFAANPSADFGLVGMSDMNGRLSPTPMARAQAVLGYWRDCNNDGYIGDRATGLLDYPLSTPGVDERVCQPGSGHNPGDPIQPGEIDEDEFVIGEQVGGTKIGDYSAAGPFVHEVIHIGFDEADVNDRDEITPWSVNDTKARVWMDITLPTQQAVLTNAITPLPFETLDSYNGHIEYVDDLTFKQGSQAYVAAYTVANGGLVGAPPTIYDTPLAANSPETPVALAHRTYTQKTVDDRDGNPMVAVWDCSEEDPEAEPTLNPRIADPEGSVGDSFNNSLRGLRVFYTNPADNEPGRVLVGQGCGEADQDALFPNGNGFGSLQHEKQPNAPQKTSTDFYMTYAPPRAQPDFQLVSGKAVPTFANGLWSAPLNLLRPTTNPQEFGYGVTKSNHWVFYAKVDTTLHNPGALPGTKLVNGQFTPPAYVYGEEACSSPGTNYNGWDCSAWPAASDAWVNDQQDTEATRDWAIVLGETYQLRDIDCTDFTPAGGETWKDTRFAAEDAYDLAMTSVSDPQPEPSNLANSYC